MVPEILKISKRGLLRLLNRSIVASLDLKKGLQDEFVVKATKLIFRKRIRICDFKDF
jgi:hypothetical protein